MHSIPVRFDPNHRSVAVQTMGCKVNTFESELIAEKFQLDGISRTLSVDDASLVVINTCTVTSEADRQARQLVRRTVRRNPAAKIVVTGCYAEMDPEACAKIPGVDLVVGNSQKLVIPELVDDLFKNRLPPVLLKDIDKEISLPKELLTGYEGKSRAFVQIQQGCDQGCTFCIIHVARGPNRSFDSRMIRRQCERLVMNGYGELVLCGVDVGSYGTDLDDESENLVELVRSLCDLEGDYRLRLSSIDPFHISDQFIELMAESDRICPQLHLSLQSANTLILKRMKRRSSRELILERIANLRDSVPDLVLSADILVGFPTETREQFLDTLDAIDELEIPFPHVFSYSPRQGTPAARIPKQVNSEDKKVRSKEIRVAGQRVWKKTAEGLIGKRLRILREGACPDSNGLETGRADNYFQVQVPPEMWKNGQWADVTINRVGRNTLLV